jgi:hypothetical protein
MKRLLLATLMSVVLLGLAATPADGVALVWRFAIA